MMDFIEYDSEMQICHLEGFPVLKLLCLSITQTKCSFKLRDLIMSTS